MSEQVTETGAPFLVICGMHRSNTSLLARTVAEAGADVGDKLVGANESNPYGHYEHVELLRFHRDVLQKNGQSWRAWRHRRLNVSEADRAHAFQLVEDARVGDKVCGFKVPDATLLLDFWTQHPDARFVFIFREPEKTIYSVLRRSGNQIYYKPYFALNALLTYCVYNENIREFMRRSPERCVLFHNESLLASPSSVIERIASRFSLPLDKDAASDALVDRNIKGMQHKRLAQWYSKTLGQSGRAKSVYGDLLSMAETF